tara:strand:- start:45 stop:602 length:558 start_codon:yes stop_codon:yes gene_type:complete
MARSFTKLFKSVSSSQVLIAIAAIALVFALMSYSNAKGSEGAGPRLSGNNGKAGGVPQQGVSPSGVSPALPLGQNEKPLSVAGLSTTANLPSSCSKAPVEDPSQLLPSDQNSKWAQLNPQGSGDLQNVNLLQAGVHTGINTVGTSLRNANLQLRSEPANPQLNVGPWHNTTIEPDARSQQFEIGC